VTPRFKALIIVTVWPEPESSAAGWRVGNTIDILKDMGAKVTVASPSRENAFSDRLKAHEVTVQPVAINDSSFDEWIAAERFDLAILDRFIIEEQFGWRIAEHSPHTVRVLDTEDLHFLRRARQAALKSGAPLSDIFDDQIPLITEDACREIASIYRSDLSLVLSDHERDLLKDRFGVDPHLLGMFRFCYRDLPQTPAFSDRENFVAIGNFRHPPNADATEWLKREIWPLIQKELSPEQRGAELHIYGAYPSRETMALTSPSDRFYVKGPVDDAHETLKQYRVNLAPLRFGAGIKGKISDGWRAGLPVVTTPIGAEGMLLQEATPVFGGEIARNAAEFARSASRIYCNAAAWSTAQERGRIILREYFDYQKNSKALASQLMELMSHIESRRAQNFVGKMLHHQSMRSTKYFAKWLELKEARDRPLVPELQRPQG
jgi:hypothetical protein